VTPEELRVLRGGGTLRCADVPKARSLLAALASRFGFGGFLRALPGIPWTKSASREETLQLALPAGSVLRLDNANGATQIVGEDRSDIRLVARKEARAESEESAGRLAENIRLLHREDAGGALEIEVDVPGRWSRRCRADLKLHVPRGTDVHVSSANARICVSGLRAAVRLSSSNGPVRVSDVVGNIAIQTSNAKVHTECTCGKLVARSSNGKVELAEHRGSVDAATSNGTIRCSLVALNERGCVLVTSNGRIALELPEQVDGDVDIRVDNGVIRSAREFPQSARERSGRLRGTLGQGGAPIRLRASNGAISLR